jgi:predicted alpha/beta-hydrolase family hydrolase
MHAAHQSLRVPAAGLVLEADLVVPEPALGVVLFAHGSGSSRHSPRNRQVAGVLQRAGLATVLADLLTPAEELRDARTGASGSTSSCSPGGWRP